MEHKVNVDDSSLSSGEADELNGLLQVAKCDIIVLHYYVYGAS